MRFLFLTLSLVVLRSASRQQADEGTRHLLDDAVSSLEKTLQYLEDQVANINLDGAVGPQFAQIILHSFAKNRPEVLDGLDLRSTVESITAQARRILTKARQSLKKTQPGYFATLGSVLNMNDIIFYQPSRLTNPALVVETAPCAKNILNEIASDQCFAAVVGRLGDPSSCNITKECLEMESPTNRGSYYITHQVLYFQFAQMHNCTEKSEQLRTMLESLPDILCSNILQQAFEIAERDYPVSWQDLFFEQIGVCGMWGYKDFYRPDFLRKIIELQSDSGCYKNQDYEECFEPDATVKRKRTKREEKKLASGCFSHKTSVAVIALAASIRYAMEEIYDSACSNGSQELSRNACFVLIASLLSLYVYRNAR